MRTMRRLLWRGWFFTLALLSALSGSAATVMDMKCDYRVDPLGIENTRPRLGWTLHSTIRGNRQTAYQILVAGSRERLQQNRGDLWDSGKVESKESIQALYRGKALTSRQTCFWKARVWDAAGKVGSWSKPAFWEMALLSPQDWKAQWLNDGKANPSKDEEFYKEDPAPLFRKEFVLPHGPVRARLYISGLGYYGASLDGKPIGDHALDPGWTRYSERVLYSVYDVTPLLHPGANCLGVTLGNGWYNPLPLWMWGHLNLRAHLPVGRPRFIAQLEVVFADGSRQSVVSDSAWKVHEGPIRFNSIYLGEVYDARQEQEGWDRPGFADSGWHRPVVATEPVGPLHAQLQPPIRVTRSLKPVNMTAPKPGVFLFDMGQNFAGWVNLRLSAPAGTKITLRYGELLHPDGMLNPMTSVAGQIKGVNVGGPGAPPVAWQSDTYIAAGQGVESYTPRFTFHAFRYVEVTGYPGAPPRDMITGLRLNADVERVGSFACSNDRFNRIQEMCDWTFLSNLFSVQSDCPHRERFGYGGDLAATSEAFMMNYDMETFYAKVMADWNDSALPDGMLTDTAPFVGIQYCGVVWAMAHPLVQRQLYQYYGDRRLIEEQYAASKRWLDLVARQYPDHIVREGLSDHESLTPAPAPEMVTPLYETSARTVGELAAILGHADEAASYRKLAEAIRSAYLDKFVDKNGRVGPGTQASQSFSLYEGLLPPDRKQDALRLLLEDIRGPQKQHLSTGILGTKFMLDVLSREGYSEEAYGLVNQKTFPGWGYMLENGATTLWEHWQGSDNTYSHNHPMFGSVSEWFYHWLGGIRPYPEAVGFDQILLQPQVVPDLNWVQCSYHSVRGKIVSSWRRNGSRLLLEFEIPVSAEALVTLPADKPEQVTESGKPVSQAKGVTFVRKERGALLYRVGSGHYLFEVPAESRGAESTVHRSP